MCALVKSDGVIGLLPMPNGGWISSTTQMSIEQDAAPLPTGRLDAGRLAGRSSGVPVLTRPGTRPPEILVTSAVRSPSWSR